MDGYAPKRITAPAAAAAVTACRIVHQGGKTAATGPLGRGAIAEASATPNGPNAPKTSKAAEIAFMIVR
jgi:hypothetical protein